VRNIRFARPLHLQLDFRAPTGHRTQPRRTAVALHPADDRFSYAHPVVGDGVQVEPRPPVPYGDEDRAALDLGEDLDGTALATVLGGVDHRLACGLHLRRQLLVERAVTDDHDLQRDPVLVLDLGGGTLDRLGEARRFLGLLLAGALRVVQPVAELPLLGAGEPPDLAAVVRVALDQGERVQDGVVDMGGDLGTLLGPDAHEAFL